MPYVVQSRTALEMACERQTSDPVYTEKSCRMYLGYPPTRAALGLPTAVRSWRHSRKSLAALPLSRCVEESNSRAQQSHQLRRLASQLLITSLQSVANCLY